MRNRTKIAITIAGIVLIFACGLAMHFDQSEYVTVDGTQAVFDDGTIRFEWDTNLYHYKRFSKYPTLVLKEKVEGQRVRFRYVQHREGMPDSLSGADIQAADEAYNWYDGGWATIGSGPLEILNNKDFLYYFLYFGDYKFKHHGEAIIICDTENTAVVCMDIFMPKRKSEAIREQIADMVITHKFETVIDSLEFSY